MSHDDVFFSRYGPRTARGGIKSQTSRGSFGKNWWAERWISVLESFDLGGRLARGRTYARRGQVLSIDIQEGAVKSMVQGSRRDPYNVQVRVKTIPLKKWIELSQTGFSQAIVAAKLLSGVMPKDIEELFEEHDLTLFPDKMDDLETDCSCPDYSNPCKHIAAVYYLLGEEFDRDPFLIFRMRGMRKEQLIALITKVDAEPVRKGKRKSKTKVLDLDPELIIEPQAFSDEGVPEESVGEAESFPLTADLFWTAESTPDLVGSVKIPAVNASLPKRLGNLPFWRSKQALMPTLEQIYKLASENSTKDLSTETLQE